MVREREACGRIIDTFAARDLGLPDKPILRDDIGQYSMDASYALKLRKLRYSCKEQTKTSGL